MSQENDPTINPCRPDLPPQFAEHVQEDKASGAWEARFRSMLESIPLAALMLDQHGNITFCNDSLLRLVGCSRQELLVPGALHWFFDPLTCDWVHAALSPATPAHAPGQRMEGQVVCCGSSPRTLVWTCAQIHTQDGSSLAGLTLLGEDVTEQRQAEREMASREQFLALLNQISHTLLRSEDRPAMLQALAAGLCEIIGVDGCLVKLWDEVQNLPVKAAYYARPGFENEAPEYHPGEQTITQAVLASGQPLAILDIKSTALLSHRLIQSCPRWGSLLAAPLQAQGSGLGAVILISERRRQFTPLEISRCQQAADLASLVIIKTHWIEESSRSAAELKSLMHISNLLQSAGSLAEVAPLVLSQLLELFNSQAVALLVLEPERQVLRVEMGAGEWFTWSGDRLPIDHSLSGDILKRRQPYLNNNIQTDSRIVRPERFSTLRAMIAVPLYADHQALGVLLVGRTLHFDKKDLHLLEAFAAQVSGRLQRVMLHESLGRALQESRLLTSITQDLLGEAFDLDASLQGITDAAWKLIPQIEQAVIHLLDEETDMLYPAAISGVPATGDSGYTMKLGEGIAGLVVQSGELVSTGDIQNDPRYINMGRRTRMKSMLVAPISGKSRRLGAISVQSQQPDAFSQLHAQLLTQLGSIAAIAIENARMYRAEHQERLLAEALAHAADSLNRSLDISTVTEQILLQALKVFPGAGGNIMLIEGDQARIAHHAGQSVEAGICYPLTLPTLSHMLATGKPLMIPDTSLSELWIPLPGTDWIRSYAGMPLKEGERVIGFLNIHLDRFHNFEQQAASRLQAFAAHASIAIQNASLHANLRSQFEELKVAQARLLQSEKLAALGELVAGVAHELNNPLTSVILYAQMLQRFPDSASANHNLEMIVSEALRSSKIVRGLLAFARQRPPERRPVNINDVLHAVMDLMAYELQTHKIQLITHLSPDIPLSMADPFQMEQVFINIINNAWQALAHIDHPGQIEITTALIHPPINSEAYPASSSGEPPSPFSETSPTIRITFKDNGPGISPEFLSRIFDPFFTTKRAGEGTGLGLATAYGLINEHGGQIWVESESGHGATFFIDLPVVDVFQATLAVNQPILQEAKNATSLARILVIDDEPGVLDVLTTVLNRSRYQVFPASEIQPALQTLQQQPIDLVLCDIRMPNFSGPEFYAQAKASGHDLSHRILFITGDAGSPETRAFLEETGAPHLNKPFELDTLLARIRELLQHTPPK